MPSILACWVSHCFSRSSISGIASGKIVRGRLGREISGYSKKTSLFWEIDTLGLDIQSDYWCNDIYLQHQGAIQSTISEVSFVYYSLNNGIAYWHALVFRHAMLTCSGHKV